MKNLLVLMCIICFSGCKGQTQESVEALGSWEICVSQRNGIEEHPNHCPEITFFSDGNGVLEASDPSSKFQWKIVEDKIFFTFKSSHDEEQFLSKQKELKMQVLS